VSDVLARLAAWAGEQEGLVGHVRAHAPPEDPGPGLGAVAAAGPRAAGDEADYELLVEAIYEGYLLHYGAPRAIRPDGEDLALLAGDALYALGLQRLAALGDLEAVSELADVIALSARAHAGGTPDLAAAAWEAGARAVGYGTNSAHREAKARAHDGEDEAAEALRSAFSGRL
jgi:hypothetical protein